MSVDNEEDLATAISDSQRPVPIQMDPTEQQPSLGDSGEQIFDDTKSIPSSSEEFIPAGQFYPRGCEEAQPANAELVVGKPKFTYKLPQPHRSDMRIDNVNPEVSKEYDQLMNKFGDLVEAVYDCIKQSSSYSKFYVYLGVVGCSMKLKKMRKPANWDDMFEMLSENKEWDCLNYHLLRVIFQKYLQESPLYSILEEKFSQYDKDVGSFLHDTKLLDFLDVYKELLPEDSGRVQDGCKMLKAKLVGDLREITVAEFHTKRGYLMRHFKLRHYALHLVEANNGCVILFWHISECLELHLRNVCSSLQPDFGQAGIIEISIDNYVLYQAKNIQDIVENEDISPVSAVMSAYDRHYDESIKSPEKFWSHMAAKELQWDKRFTQNDVMKKCDMAKGKINFFDGTLNASVNCLDRHAELTPHKVAIIWEKNSGDHEKITYQKLLNMTCQLAHVLKNKGIQKNDIVLIYMSSSPMAVAAMLACTRIGAIHSVAYAVLKCTELEARIMDSHPKCIITSDLVMIGEKPYDLKSTLEKVLSSIDSKKLHRARSRRGSVAKPLETEFSSKQQEHDLKIPDEKLMTTRKYPIVLTFNTSGKEKEEDIESEMKKCPSAFEPVPVEAEHTMFIMYTSGTTASSVPVGIRHCTAGYLLYVALSHKYVFDYKPGDVFGCMSAIGWITGHSYVVYGPLCNGATTVLFEGTASYPNSGRYWKAINDHKINQLYITPHAISRFMRESGKATEYKEKYDLSSLKTIATVGEPLKISLLDWFLENIGNQHCKFVDTWWQTETGGIALIVDHRKDLPEGNFPAKPFFGVDPVIIDPNLKGRLSNATTEPGYLCLKQALPGMGRSITSLKCEKNFEEIYFQHKGYGFFTHDLALKLESGGYRITGRVDDAIRIQGVWLDVASIEDQMNRSDERILKTTLVGIPNKTINNTKFECESACIFMETQSNDPLIMDELTRKVETICTDECSLMSSDEVVVLPVIEWPLTHSGKTIINLYQTFITFITKIWMWNSTEENFKQLCKKVWNSLL